MKNVGDVYQEHGMVSSKCLVLLVFILMTVGCTSGTQCEVPKDISERVANIRGLSFHRPVECRLANRRQARKYLEQTLEKKLRPEKLRNEAILYQALGLVPPGYRYVENILDIFKERFAAFYSAELGFFVMTNSGGSGSTIAHELVHALQDQHFGVQQLLDGSLSSDELVARTAVLEGDANIVMRRFAGQPVCAGEQEALVQLEARAKLEASPEIPLGLQLFMTFPYIYGERLVCEAIRRDGEHGLERLYQRLPRSTRELIRPEVYFGEREPAPAAPRLSEAGEYRDTLGALGTFAVLASQLPIPESSWVLEHWRSDEAVLFKDKSTRWTVRFDSEGSAQRFAASAAKAAEKRLGEALTVVESKVFRGSSRLSLEHRADTVTMTVPGR